MVSPIIPRAVRMSKEKSPTERLVSQIEAAAGIIFGETQRREICDLVRAYRFTQISAAMMKLKQLMKDSGNADLSEHLFSDFEP